jgi:hypothetical protein
MADKRGKQDQRGFLDRTFEGGAKGFLGCLAIPVVALLVLIVALSWGDDEAPVEEASTIPAVAEVAPPVATAAYTDKQLSMICRAGIAAEFGRSHKIMTATLVEPGMMRVQYRRPDDRKLWKSDCKVEGDRIVWRTVDAFEGDGPGRWRTSADDDVLTFVIKGNAVTTNSSDGSSASETYRF